ncbi:MULTISPECIES: carboxymuconolactone decarboxylase family protein [unclassified Mycobacterium]|uniref:carboxymuconolactone decarboxylase family protein n=1 Tax=unclassified Mycobacterium TaxID=2642494 RepID=UPI0007FE9DAA|nr:MULTISPECIES: carboxymuconolactone decarboxylase family protein [unclassified Mycobacterium]OBG71067.1 4-carboxymuconolactone decarboxylase [Mycobacterium sp. E1214]OBH23370.1 4-carboxymuconolactone decarboxylase [Mycobacterium sp. E1319]
MTGGTVGRIPSGRFRELGPLNWVLAKAAARTVRAPEMHLFTTLGQHRSLFVAWSIYSGRLLRGRLPAIDAELVVLRVAHLRNCEYELQHHRRMARNQGLDADLQAAIFAWPDTTVAAADRLSARQRALLTATDEFVERRTVTDDTWAALAGHLDRRELIEFCLLASQYDGLAATMSALAIPLDNPAGYK